MIMIAEYPSIYTSRYEGNYNIISNIPHYCFYVKDDKAYLINHETTLESYNGCKILYISTDEVVSTRWDTEGTFIYLKCLEFIISHKFKIVFNSKNYSTNEWLKDQKKHEEYMIIDKANKILQGRHIVEYNKIIVNLSKSDFAVCNKVNELLKKLTEVPSVSNINHAIHMSRKR
jgi:hypothetical protein